MVATPRKSGTDDDTTPDEQTMSAVQGEPHPSVPLTAMEMMDHAMRAFGAVRDERVRAEAAVAELRRERELLAYESRRERERAAAEREIHAFEQKKLWHEREDQQRTAFAASRPGGNILRSLQFVAGCALAGAVLTGIILGHDIRGVDPTYFGALAGLVAGFGTWAVRGL